MSTETLETVAHRIQLEIPGMQSLTTLVEALQLRCSTRVFSDAEIRLGDLSGLLWAADGVNRADGHRTAASALGKNDVSIYVVSAYGTYLYNADDSALELVSDKDLREFIVGQQIDFAVPVLAVLLATTPSVFGIDNNEVAMAMGAVDVGIVAQNIMLYCAANEMVCVPRASMDNDVLSRALNLDRSTRLLLNIPIGYAKL